MKFYYKYLLFAVTLMLCLPFNNYAAFPVKRAELRTAASTPVNADNTSIGKNQTSENHRSSFVERTIKKISRFAENKGERLHHELAIFWAVFSVLCGGLGLQRFFLGYIGAGFVQLSGVVCAGLGVALIVASSAGTALIIPGAILIAAWMVTFVWSIVDLVRICTGDLTTKHRVPSSLFRYR